MHTISKMNPVTPSLKTALETFRRKHEFKVGDLVEWKPGMAYKAVEGPFIVVEVLPEPLCNDENGAGSPYFMEPLDLVLGLWVPDRDGIQDFVCLYMDSRRFQPLGYKQEIEPTCAGDCPECNTPTSS